MDRLVSPSFTPDFLAQAFCVVPVLAHTTPVAHILTDSRSLVMPASTLFFAIRTDSGDGHQYIAQLYEAGVRSFVVEQLSAEDKARYVGANWYLVPSSVKALQALARAHRERFARLQTVGITGSNGKTIVKELLYQLLAPCLRTVRSPRSYNSQIGVPLSVLSITEEDEVALIEAGISLPGEMAALEEVIAPEVGVFTSLGSAHQEGFASLEEKLEEKLRLFVRSASLFYGKDDALVASAMERLYPTKQHYTWSRVDPAATVYVQTTSAEDEGETLLVCSIAGEVYRLSIPFTDAAYIEDVLCCIAVVSVLAPQLLSTREVWRQLSSVSMRLEVKDGIQGNTLIDDAYSCDLQSLSIALDFLRRRASATSSRPVLLLSDIEGSGRRDEDLYGEVATMLSDYGVEEVFAVGEGLMRARDLFATLQLHSFRTTAELLASPSLLALHDACILIKGARRFALDQVYRRLSSREHQTVLDIDLSAVVHNLNHYRSLLPPHHPLICMIKADGYGTGAFELARTLQEHRVDYLAVAVADEGRELREKGIRTHIMIMNPELSVADTLFAHQLEPEVYSMELLEGLCQKARQAGIKGFPIHLKVDSGMHRLGFAPADLPRVGAYLREHPELCVSSVFSHLAAADESEKVAFTERQAKTFVAATEALSQALGYQPKRHLLNTAGIERYGAYALDMARLGIGLYGISATGLGGVKPIARLTTVLLQIRELPAGEAIGYGCRGLTERPSRIAVIPIGYADGFSRRLSRGAYSVMLHGRLCPTIGNVCMDACMIDITDVPEARVGDQVLIFGGEEHPIGVMAEACDTIPYEILTTLSSRIQRRYWRE